MAHRQLNRDEVARVAYEIYLSRGGEHGHDQDDWYLAEHELGQSSGDAEKPGRPLPDKRDAGTRSGRARR